MTNSVCLPEVLGGKEGLPTMRQRGTFLGDANVLYLDHHGRLHKYIHILMTNQLLTRKVILK